MVKSKEFLDAERFLAEAQPEETGIGRPLLPHGGQPQMQDNSTAAPLPLTVSVEFEDVFVGPACEPGENYWTQRIGSPLLGYENNCCTLL